MSSLRKTPDTYGVGVVYKHGEPPTLHEGCTCDEMNFYGANAVCWQWFPYETMGLEEVKRLVGLLPPLPPPPPKPSFRVVK